MTKLPSTFGQNPLRVWAPTAIRSGLPAAILAMVSVLLPLMISISGGLVAAPAAPAPEPALTKPAEPVMPVAGAPAPAATTGGTVLASPAARVSAAELGIALETVTGSGPGGAILLSDVERHVPAPATPFAAPAPEERPKGKPGLDMTEMRRAIAAAMSRSKREIPHYYLSHEIDLQTAQDWLTATNAGRTPDQRLLMGAILIGAVVRALAKVPELNGRFEAEPFAPSTAVHCGLAVGRCGVAV